MSENSKPHLPFRLSPNSLLIQRQEACTIYRERTLLSGQHSQRLFAQLSSSIKAGDDPVRISPDYIPNLVSLYHQLSEHEDQPNAALYASVLFQTCVRLELLPLPD